MSERVRLRVCMSVCLRARVLVRVCACVPSASLVRPCLCLCLRGSLCRRLSLYLCMYQCLCVAPACDLLGLSKIRTVPAIAADGPYPRPNQERRKRSLVLV